MTQELDLKVYIIKYENDGVEYIKAESVKEALNIFSARFGLDEEETKKSVKKIKESEFDMLMQADFDLAFKSQATDRGVKYKINGIEIYISFPTSLPTQAVVRRYYQDGKVCYQCCIENEKLNGKYSGYYKDGSVWYEYDYRNGIVNGKSLIYYHNGKVANESNYKNGVLEGKRLGYSECGKLEYEFEYAKGIRI